MMEEVFLKVLLTVVGGLTASLLGWLGVQITKYKKLINEQEDRQLKATIENSLNPIKTDIGTIKQDVSNMKADIINLQNSEINFTTRLTPMQEEIEHLKDDITIILNDLKEQGVNLKNICEKEKNLEHETRCAWRYRIRTLCHAYQRRGWMSHDEFAQLQEMFNLYTAIGGNGQTKELYERTMRLDVLTDAEEKEIK